MVRCVSSYLDFIYLARRDSHSDTTLHLMEHALDQFFKYRTTFTDLQPDGIFAVPRQQALVHWVRAIQLFGSPNGLCTSITESKHIDAVKKPWRRSSKNNPIGQIIRTLTRLNKLAAARIEFERRGMIPRDVAINEDTSNDEEDMADIEGEHVESEVTLGRRARTLLPRSCDSSFLTCYLVRHMYPEDLATELKQPRLPHALRLFIHDQTNSGTPSDSVPEEQLPVLTGRISTYSCAHATYYAPSDFSGTGGMHREVIRCNPSWLGKHPRYDTVLVQNGDEEGMRGMIVGRVLQLCKFTHDGVTYPCAFVEWFVRTSDEPDPVTGLWIVKPQLNGRRRDVGFVHLDCVVRGCQLIGVYGNDFLPINFCHSWTHTLFRRFYVNRWTDYHSHECIQ
jgi:hypothetical protein